MGSSRIEQLIDDIYEFVESCKMSPLSQTKVIVPKDELYDLLDELKLRTPDEIKRYQKIIANRDSILADAEKKSGEIQEAARNKAQLLVNEHEIMQQVYQQANEILSNANAQADSILKSANEDAQQIRSGALNYTNDMLAQVESVLHSAYESSKARTETLLTALKGNLEVVAENRRELCRQTSDDNDIAENMEQELLHDHAAYSDDDYNFDADTFLKDVE